MTKPNLTRAATGAGLVACAALGASVFEAQAQDIVYDGEGLYTAACQSCHGEDGAGVERDRVAFDTPLPDFTDCAFSSREPDPDWVAVAHQGGPVRAFDETMPAFGEALTEEQLLLIMGYIRGFCTDDRWPRGELNIPRPLLTEKAYPEDEGVTTVTINTEGPTSVVNDLLYEKRFGPKSQIEIEVPFGWVESGDVSVAGLGDIALGVKHTLWHTLEGGAILSAGAEVVLPTGDEIDGLGKGTTILEPYLALGKLLGEAGFLHLQALLEQPVGQNIETGSEEEKLNTEAVWRAALGFSTTEGEWGRTWSPMIEVQGAHEFGDDASTAWDIVPQFQVTLNTRQHIMANVGLRLPLTDSDVRNTQLMIYILWDWFDGGFFDGW